MCVENKIEDKFVLGVSSSPIPNSNTDKALKAVLDATGCKTEFIKLSNYKIEPCRACLGCVKTNKCVINDDGIMLAEKAKNADAIVIASFTPYSSLDSRAKAFLERLYPLRHQKGYMRNKVGAAVVTSSIPQGTPQLPPAGDMGINAISFYMMEEGMNFVGSVRVLGNVPCIRCGHGDDCVMSAIKMMFGPTATVDTVGKNCFDEQPQTIKAAEELGRKIAENLSKT
jgi:multimeric flavodoxin WrbA